MRRLLAAAALANTLALEVPAQTGEAFEFDETGRQIVVDRETHWRNWVYQNNLVRDVRAPMDSTGLFDFSGGVKPRYFPAVRNYVLDREEFSFVDNVRFRGQTVTVTGRITALSNDELAGRVGDGDLTTFWEPSGADFNPEGLRNWQLLVDLGRVVFADSIVVHFPPAGTGEDLGDAPKLFTVEVSMGTQAGDREYHFDVVGRQSVSGNQRRFVFPLRPLDQADADLDGEPDFEGTFVHFVRLAIFDSDLEAAELIGEGESGRQAYEALAPERRGMRIFQRRTAGDFVKRIDPLLGDGGDTLQTAEETYLSLPDPERGPIQYFKRELPRVSEIEVIGRGPNLAYRPQRRAGAAYEDGGKGAPLNAVDGVYLTNWNGNAWDLSFSSGFAGHGDLVFGTMWLDLGATFWIDRILLGMVPVSETETGGILFGWYLDGSDGTVLRALDMRTPEDFIQLEKSLEWRDLVSDVYKDNNTARVRMMAESFELRRLRFFQQRNDDPTGRFSGTYGAAGHFNELQMFGRGYPAEVSFTSPEIVLLPGVAREEAAGVRERRVLSEIRWEAEAVVREVEAETGQAVERTGPLELNPAVELLLQTRTSDTIDSLFSYFQVATTGTRRRAEVEVADYEALVELWEVFRAWEALPESAQITLRDHSDGDDDGDGVANEDPIDGLDNDGDKLIDEDAGAGESGGPQSIRGAGTIELTRHQRRQDDDGDGAEDEDPIDGIDNDGDFLVDEDGKKAAQPRQEAERVVTPVFAGWSAWSEPYKAIGTEARAEITSPSPRKFLQARVTIRSEDPEVTARIRSLRVDLAVPISTDLAGELAVLTDAGRQLTGLAAAREDYRPPQGVEPLERTPYAFFVRAAGPDPNAPEAAGGFDEMLLLTPSSARLTGVRLGRVAVEDLPGAESKADRRAGGSAFERAFLPGEGDGRFRDGEGNELIATASGDSLLLRFPGSVNAGYSENENALVELRFETRTLRAGSEFVALVRNAAGSGVFQRVESEGRDATELVDSGTARPGIVQVGEIVGEIRIPGVFTPNGDGVNDLLHIEFTVLTIREDRPVEVALHDLSGRRIAKAAPRDRSGKTRSGTVSFTWDGRAGEGMAPPGIYIARVQLNTDAGDFEAVRLVNVVY